MEENKIHEEESEIIEAPGSISEPEGKPQIQHKKPKLRNYIGMFLAVVLLVGLAIGGYAVVYEMRHKSDSPASTAKKGPYSEYLEKTSGDDELIEVGLDYSEEDGQYLLTINNGNDSFFSGKIKLYDDNNSVVLKTVTITNVRPEAMSYVWIDLKKEATGYEITGSSYLGFNYEKPSIKAEYTYDYDDNTSWTNIQFDIKTEMTPENMMGFAKYNFAEDFVGQIESDDIFFYSKEAKMIENEGYILPDTSSALYQAKLDQVTGVITLIDLKNGEAVLLQETMEV